MLTHTTYNADLDTENVDDETLYEKQILLHLICGLLHTIHVENVHTCINFTYMYKLYIHVETLHPCRNFI